VSSSERYRQHLETLDRQLADALERAGRAGVALEGVLFHAGRAELYHADDEPVTFRATPHFRRWVPLPGPEHAVLARPGRRPLVVRVQPRDFWYDTSPPPRSYWEDSVDLQEVESFSDLPKVTGPLPRVAYVGNSAAAAGEAGIPAQRIEPAPLLAPLDWHRAAKTPHEVALIEFACRKAADGHRSARQAFEQGGSEREIHWAYLQGSDQVEGENPFSTIVALDEKAAILHYQGKRGGEAAPGRVLLLDAGAAFSGYAADVTRTWVRPAADSSFRALLEGLDALERDLVAMVAPGRPYPEIHLEAHRLVADLLVAVGIVKGSAQEAVERRVTRAFFPHGVGHLLGIQVHEVGGRQASPEGGELPPPDDHVLRNTRTLEPGHVVTIEPGIYFIPMLLGPLREGEAAHLVDWSLVDLLMPYGGARIEDDVLCTDSGPRDLTRPKLEGPRGV